MDEKKKEILKKRKRLRVWALIFLLLAILLAYLSTQVENITKITVSTAPEGSVYEKIL